MRDEPLGQPPMLVITDKARDKIRALRSLSGEGDASVRIAVRPEAPLAGKYELEFISPCSARDDDLQITFEDLVFVLDRRSAELISGTTMDYREGMWSSGFHFDNPNRQALLADPLGARLQRVIQERVIPMLAAHGGVVWLVDVREQRAYLQFGGGCQGCGLAPQTLKHGVVQLLRQEVPEILEVVDVTDHAAGEAPYYPSA